MLFDRPALLDGDTVLDWHSLCTAGLIREREMAYTCLRHQTPIPEYLSGALSIGSTESEADAFFVSSQRELDLSAAFTLIACAEARVRLDAARRIDGSDIDFLSQQLKALRSRVDEDWKVPFYDWGIMEIWKSYVSSLDELPPQDRSRITSAIGSVRIALGLRHWIAHGRYWVLTRDVRSFQPAAVARMVDQLYAALTEAARAGNLKPFT